MKHHSRSIYQSRHTCVCFIPSSKTTCCQATWFHFRGLLLSGKHTCTWLVLTTWNLNKKILPILLLPPDSILLCSALYMNQKKWTGVRARTSESKTARESRNAILPDEGSYAHLQQLKCEQVQSAKKLATQRFVDWTAACQLMSQESWSCWCLSLECAL